MSRAIQNYKIRKMRPEDNVAVAELARYNLKKNGLDIPGTVYFDPALDNLYEFYYGKPGRGYFVLVDGEEQVVGGVGFAEFGIFSDCAELQKLYLADAVKGMGFGYRMTQFVEEKMKEAGYCNSYLETHENLKIAIHLYEKSGYRRIARPKAVMHGAMTHFFYKELEK